MLEDSLTDESDSGVALLNATLLSVVGLLFADKPMVSESLGRWLVRPGVRPFPDWR